MFARFLALIGVLIFVLLNVGIYNWGVESTPWHSGWSGLAVFWICVVIFCAMIGVAIGDDKIKSVGFTVAIALVLVVAVGGLLSNDSFHNWVGKLLPDVDVQWQSPIVINETPSTECLCITETPEP